MKPENDQPVLKDDLKSLPMAELQAKLNSSPDGLTQAEAQSGWTNTARTRSKKRKSMPS